MPRLLNVLFVITFVTGCSSAAGPTTSPQTAGPTPGPTATPSPVLTLTPTPSPTLLARGTFMNKDATVELEATRVGSNVDGTMTMFDPDFSFTVELECTAKTPGGLIVIGGSTTTSTFELAPTDSRVAIVLERGSPVRAHPHFEAPDPPAETCLEFLDTVTDADSALVLEAIEGNVELGP